MVLSTPPRPEESLSLQPCPDEAPGESPLRSQAESPLRCVPMAFSDPEQSRLCSQLRLGRCPTPEVSEAPQDQRLWEQSGTSQDCRHQSDFPSPDTTLQGKTVCLSSCCVRAARLSSVSSYPRFCRGLGAKGLSSSYLRTRGLPLVWGHNQIRHDKEDIFTLEGTQQGRKC